MTLLQHTHAEAHCVFGFDRSVEQETGPFMPTGALLRHRRASRRCATANAPLSPSSTQSLTACPEKLAKEGARGQDQRRHFSPFAAGCSPHAWKAPLCCAAARQNWGKVRFTARPDVSPPAAEERREERRSGRERTDSEELFVPFPTTPPDRSFVRHPLRRLFSHCGRLPPSHAHRRLPSGGAGAAARVSLSPPLSHVPRQRSLRTAAEQIHSPPQSLVPPPLPHAAHQHR